ncbi:MAG: CBS domain-containing protein [Planctomycetes bacterium]|nr:CBS domain-containing protein [Planctomycetota bacterium]
MKVSDVMTLSVEVVRPDTTIREAADKMKGQDIGVLPVCEDDRVVGIVTDRDIVLRSVSGGHDPRTDLVRHAMTSGVFYCFEDQHPAEAARLMREKEVRRLPVLSRDMRLVGIVSLGDLVAITGDTELAGHTLEEVSQPARPNR